MLDYAFDPPHGATWKLVEGDVKDVQGSYRFEESAGATVATCTQGIDLGFWLPGFIRSGFEKKALHDSVEEFRRAVERATGERSGRDLLTAPGYWPSPWPCEDGGPRRSAAPDGPGLGVRAGERLVVTGRDAPGATMVVLRDAGEVFLAGHTFGPGSRAWVERLDVETLAPLARSPELAAGPWWPGGIAAHRNGSLYVTCGRWCHRLDAGCVPLAARELPRDRAATTRSSSCPTATWS